jgi:hypothetical protein
VAIYERHPGPGQVEREHTVDGSERDAELSALVAEGVNGWTVFTPAAPEPEALTRPADSAVKAAWVAWAIACGADEADAEKLTKPQLIEQFGDKTPSDQDGDGPSGED